MVKEITVQELSKLVENKEDFQLIDVREEFEREKSLNMMPQILGGS